MNLQETELIFSTIPNLQGAVIQDLAILKGDSSGRRYSRAILKNSPYKTVIIMELAGEPGPITGGGVTLNQDQTFILIEKYLTENNIPHPKIIADLSQQKILIVEDVGDVALWRLCRDKESNDVKEVIKVLGPDYLFKAYTKAIDVILQKKEALPLNRFKGEQEFLIEAKRFIDFYAIPKGVNEKKIAIIDSGLKDLCISISKHPRVVCHWDFMAWNIHILSDGSASILDFQDMLMAPQLYDLVCLLTDRDTDLDLGQELTDRLLDYFKERAQIKDLNPMYNEILLQRSLRLVGQFAYLSEKKKVNFYKDLIPGCIRRMKQSLRDLPQYADLEKTILDIV